MIQSVSAAIAYLLLALHQFGLGATWITGPLSQTKGDVEKFLNIPENEDVIALIPVGYVDDEPKSFRKPVKEVCTILK